MTERKRQRTTWLYRMHANDGSGAFIKVGWVHNPSRRPYKDTIRVQIRSSDRIETDQRMTPLEAISVATGLMLTVQHSGWRGYLETAGLHFDQDKKPWED